MMMKMSGRLKFHDKSINKKVHLLWPIQKSKPLKLAFFFLLQINFLRHSKLQLKNHSGDYYMPILMLIKNSFEIDPPMLLIISSRINVIIERKTTWKKSERARDERGIKSCWSNCFSSFVLTLALSQRLKKSASMISFLFNLSLLWLSKY